LRRFIVGGIAALGLLGAAPVAAPAAPTAAPPSITYHACSSGWKHAVLGDGSHKCLRAGQFCASRNQRVYRAKGFVCRVGRLRHS